ncbi:MAG: hypothetical protein SXV54_12480 [Chloroflexota bacterium]|nr:hypothetical protein [Chloroflexota bacterium]
MNKLRNMISVLVGLLALAALVVGLVWLLGPRGTLPAQQVSPLRTPTPIEHVAPTTEPIAEYIGVTASSRDWPTLTPPPSPPPAPSPTPRITPTPPAPPKDIPVYDPRIPLRAEDIALAAVQPFDPGYSITFKTWSPDGERFLFGRFSQDYVLVQFENGAGTHASWDDLWVANTDGSQLHKLADMASSWAWSPDGCSVAYLAPVKSEGPEGMLYVVDVGHLKPREVATCDLGDMYDVSWLPTDEIVCRRNGVMYAIKSDGSAMRQLNEIFSSDPVTFSGETVPPVFQGYYRISPDGKKIAYHKTSQAPGLWISNLDGSNAFKIEGLLGSSAWSPNSGNLVYGVLNGKGRLGRDLWVVNADGSNPHPVAVAEGEDARCLEPAWSPDGKVIVYTYRSHLPSEPESVWVVNTDGTNPHLLVDVAFAPQWSAKGNEIAVLRQRSVFDNPESLLILVALGQ